MCNIFPNTYSRHPSQVVEWTNDVDSIRKLFPSNTRINSFPPNLFIINRFEHQKKFENEGSRLKEEEERKEEEAAQRWCVWMAIKFLLEIAGILGEVGARHMAAINYALLRGIRSPTITLSFRTRPRWRATKLSRVSSFSSSSSRVRCPCA